MDALVRRPEFGTADSTVRAIMEATAALMKTSVDGNLSDFLRQATAMADEQHESGLTHYEGISLLNAALVARGQGNVDQAALLASRAGVVLELNSTNEEIVAARLVRVWALAHSANWREAVEESTDVLGASDALTLPEALVELAKVHLWYGDIAEAKSFVDKARGGLDVRPELAAPLRAVAYELAIRSRDFGAAEAFGRSLASGEVTPEVAFAAHCLALHAYLAIARGSDDADARTREAIAFAEAQGARFWARYVEMLAAVTRAHLDGGAAIGRTAGADAAYLSIFPNEVVARLNLLEHDALQLVRDEVHARPERWRPALREAVDEDGIVKWSAAALLDEIGERPDIPRLRRVAQTGTRTTGAKDVGRKLARRLASKVYVADLGRVSVLTGGAPVSEQHVRRKVLALLCYLVSRPDFAATRDQVVDALWPDLEPEVALNSLNQTVYFLRRVFEPRYSEVLSPGYLVHDANVLWLDRELVDARSAECWRLVTAASAGGPDSLIDALASTYSAKFALDFAYEEWAIAYREGLHAAVLQLVELAIARDTASGAYTRAIDLARRAILFDPDADHLELALLRLYRLSGAHAAAAEQYAHYAAIQRTEFGVDPPPLEMV
jgi:DNA-binding SARP family transcriptional activator